MDDKFEFDSAKYINICSQLLINVYDQGGKTLFKTTAATIVSFCL